MGNKKQSNQDPDIRIIVREEVQAAIQAATPLIVAEIKTVVVPIIIQEIRPVIREIVREEVNSAVSAAATEILTVVGERFETLEEDMKTLIGHALYDNQRRDLRILRLEQWRASV